VQPTDDQSFAATWPYAQVSGRMIKYVARGSDNPNTIAKATRTMQAKYGISRGDIERMLAEMYLGTVKDFLEFPLASPWYQPERLARFNHLKALLLA
jgi:hypothetical protein